MSKINYRKSTTETVNAYNTYKKSNPPNSLSVLSFVAGYNAALANHQDAVHKALMNKCPSCHQDMSPFDHGVCRHCGKSCGCSFDPTSMNDYCESHRPR